MKKIILFTVLFVTTIAFAQEKTFEGEVSKISKKIEKITTQEKDSLKMKIKEINIKLDKNELSETEAIQLKKQAAAYHATKIEKRVGEQEQLLQQLVQQKTDGKIASVNEDFNNEANTFSIGKRTFKFTVDGNDGDDWSSENRQKKRRRRNRKTTSQFVFALGVNNVLTDNEFSSLNDSDYKFWQSHFYEVGFSFKTRMSEEASKLYFKYGLSFLWNNLRPEGNQFHEVNGDQTDLAIYPENLSENRLRHVQMTFPMHFELDFTPDRTYDDGFTRDRSGQGFRIGLGGFFGFKLGSRQYLEYKENSLDIEEVQYGDFNMNTINYGLSAYVGYRDISLYTKYDLNPLFRNTKTRNISMGVRFDFD